MHSCRLWLLSFINSSLSVARISERCVCVHMCVHVCVYTIVVIVVVLRLLFCSVALTSQVLEDCPQTCSDPPASAS